MQVTLVKNPSRRKSTKRSGKKTASKGRSKASYRASAKKAAATRKRNAAKRSSAGKKAAATRRRNASKKTSTRKTTKRTSKNTRSRASYRAAAKKAAATRKRNASKRRTAGKKAAATRRKNAGKRKTASKRRAVARRNPDVARRLPVVGKSKYAKMFDAEMKMSAHSAQDFKKAGLIQKAVQVGGGISGYGYGGTFTQWGHGMSENILLSSGAGVVSGLAGVTLSSYAVNKGADMVLKGHEKKHHTFANLTKGFRVGGYLGVGINTVTNLLTMHYGRSYGSLGSWQGIIGEMQYDVKSAVTKAVAKASGADKLAHHPAVAGFLSGPGMYDDGTNGPLQGFKFAQNVVNTDDGSSDVNSQVYTDAGGYYADQNDQFGYVDVMGSNRSQSNIGHTDALGYPSGMGYPAQFAENQPIY